MYMTKEQFAKIRKKYSTLLVLDDDITDALEFVQDILETEAAAIEEREPTATNCIHRLYDAAHTVFGLWCDLGNNEFSGV